MEAYEKRVNRLEGLLWNDVWGDCVPRERYKRWWGKWLNGEPQSRVGHAYVSLLMYFCIQDKGHFYTSPPCILVPAWTLQRDDKSDKCKYACKYMPFLLFAINKKLFIITDFHITGFFFFLTYQILTQKLRCMHTQSVTCMYLCMNGKSFICIVFLS